MRRVAFCGVDGSTATAGERGRPHTGYTSNRRRSRSWTFSRWKAIAGIAIPDTALVREVTDFIRAAEDDLLFDHSRRVFLFGALQGRRRGLKPDLELLYVGAMFHDIGLTERYRTSTVRFEVDGANAARDFLAAHGVDEADAGKVWLGIALHTTPGVPEFLAPEVALLKPVSKSTCSASGGRIWPPTRSPLSPPPTRGRSSSSASSLPSTTA